MDSPSSDAASVPPPPPPPRDYPDPSPAPQTPERLTDVQTAIVLRSEEYRQLFRLPTEEVLVEDFNCAYQENIPVQGHMYLFAHHICFYSNIFGFETKKIIHFREITGVKRAKTAGIFPNAIEIYAGAKKYFFASFLSRDEAFNLISSGWLNHGGISSEITDRQALTPLSSFTENGSESDSAINLTNDDDGETSERDMDAPVCMESLSGHDPEDGNLSALVQKTDDNAGSSDSGLQPTAPSPSTQKAWSWNVEDVDAGRIPEELTKVAESKFPITVEEFFNMFFSDDGFLESFHKRCGDKDFKCSSWKQHDHFGHTRNVSFQHPIKLYLGARYGSCQVLQKFRVFRNSNLVIQTSQEISDIPFADYFRVEGLWDVRRDGDGSCNLSVYIGVAFVKKTMFKGKIVQSTLEECREAYASWIEMAHDLLKEKNIEKREDVTTDRSITANESACTQDAGNLGPSGTLPRPILGSDVPKNSSSTTVDRYDGWPFLQSLVNRETTVLIQDRTLKLWSRLRSQIHLPLFVAVLFTIILLIQQLSIVVLLSRSPGVQVISPSENVNSVDDTSTEAMTWLEKRLYYLKEEVSLVEARFERMQWEYSRIKQQLGELERVHHKK